MLELNQLLLESVKELVFAAGKHLKNFYARSVEVKIKPDQTPVTEADLFISQFLSEKLSALAPNVPILSEENCNIPLNERAKWQEYWIIDPLDGTQQFIDRTDQFAIVVTLVQNNRPVLGVIYAPILDKTYYAMRGYGAFLQKSGKITPLAIKNVKQIKEQPLKIAVGSKYHSDLARKAIAPREAEFIKYGSSSLKGGMVAEGIADCYVRFGDTGEWDTAAVEILLEETGGKIFDFNFNALTYNQRPTFINPYFVMVGNSRVEWDKIFSF